MSVEIGVQHIVVGFPGSSDREYADCLELLDEIKRKGWAITPWLLSRSNKADIVKALGVAQENNSAAAIAIFRGTSPLRRFVEEWSYTESLVELRDSFELIRREGALFSFNLEDATRTPPSEVKEYVNLALDYDPYSIALCDTVGESSPSGVANLVSCVRKTIKDSGKATKILWHGHNDRGLAMANSIAAIEAGANIISGSFLGIGERSGNVALEQIIYYLFDLGVETYRVDKIVKYCELLARHCGHSIPKNMPLVGEQCFTTGVGVHASAITKAINLGVDISDMVYSSISATSLGRKQNILMGPSSGMSNVRFNLDRLGIIYSEPQANELLTFIKKKSYYLSDEEILGWWKENTRS